MPLLPTRFLFRFSAPCRYLDPLWTDQQWQLDESYRLLRLSELEATGPTDAEDAASLKPSPAFADLRAAWSEAGLSFTLIVSGKRQTPVYNSARPLESDALQLWIDTRDVHTVHRAGRFCHNFVFIPRIEKPKAASTSRAKKSPAVARVYPGVAIVCPINRAREQPTPVREGVLQVRCQPTADGYLLAALIPAEALTGFDPAEHPRLGFTYAVLDRELGEQTFGVGRPMPYQEDPSLWPTLELVR